VKSRWCPSLLNHHFLRENGLTHKGQLHCPSQVSSFQCKIPGCIHSTIEEFMILKALHSCELPFFKMMFTFKHFSIFFLWIIHYSLVIRKGSLKMEVFFLFDFLTNASMLIYFLLIEYDKKYIQNVNAINNNSWSWNILLTVSIITLSYPSTLSISNKLLCTLPQIINKLILQRILRHRKS